MKLNKNLIIMSELINRDVIFFEFGVRGEDGVDEKHD
jgi:hypothetical protein